MIAKLCMVLIFIGVAVGVGIYCRRSTASVDGFVLGGRSVGPWMSAFAFGTSYFSAVVFVGYAGQFGWKYGIAAFWAGITNAILGSLLAWWVLGPRTREMTHRLGATTMPEFFGLRYDSKALRVAAAAIIFVFLIPYTASVYNGLSRLFGMAFGLPYEWCVIGMAVVTCIYVVVGGYMATVMNDFLQGIVMLVGIIAVIVAVLFNNGGFMPAITELSQMSSDLAPDMAGPFVSMFGPDPLNLLGVCILTSLGTWGLPQMVQKFYAIKSGPAVKQGAIISTLFAFVVAGGKDLRAFGDDTEAKDTHNVFYPGYVSDAENAALMKHCKLFLHPAVFEGFGIPPLEALALGAPIALANATCLPELYGDTARYFDPYDYDTDLDKLAAQPVAAPDEVLQKYSWDKTANFWLHEIEKYAKQ